MSKATQGVTRANKQGCSQANDFVSIFRAMWRLRRAGKSLRRIANEDYGGAITHSTVKRILDGYEPRDPKIREAIGLPAYQGVTPVTGATIALGAQSIGSLDCVRCGRPFIPNTAKRRLCFVCSKFRRRKA